MQTRLSKFRLIHIRFTVFLAITGIVFWACPAMAAAAFESEFQITSWQIGDGLPNNTVSAIAQTPDGFLWLGTPQGLVRFDGVQFKLLDSVNTPDLPASGVSSLFVDRAGDLWVGTEFGDIITRQRERFERRQLRPGSTHGRIGNMAQDEQGVIWVIVDDAGKKRIDVANNSSFALTNNLPTTRFANLITDTKGEVWGWSEGSLLTRRDGHWETSSDAPRLGAKAAAKIAPTHDGGLLLSTGNWWSAGFSLIHLKKGELNATLSPVPQIPGSKRSRVNALLEDQVGYVWVGTSGGGVYYAQTNSGWQPLTSEGPLSYSPVTVLYEDGEGSVWIGTQGGGLHRVRRKAVQTVFLPAELQRYIFMSVCASHDGGVWAGTDGAGIYYHRNGEFKNFRSETEADKLNVCAILEDSHTNVWIGSAGGFWRLNGNRIEAATGPNQSTKKVQAIFEDHSGRLWLGTRRNLACRSGDSWRSIAPPPGQKMSDIRSIVEDRSGAIWTAAFGEGLYRVTGDVVDYFGTNHSPGLATARALHIDHEGTLWIGSLGGGLTQFKNGRFTRWTKRDGLISDDIQALTGDDAGMLWMSSDDGIFGCPTTDLEHQKQTEDARVFCRQLLPLDGLASRVCSGIGQSATARTKDGRIWFCNSPALVAIPEGSNVSKKLRATVVLDDVLVNDRIQQVRADNVVRAKSSARRFEFRYTAPQPNSGRRLLFRYQLEGMDDHWVDVGTRRAAYYSQLPPRNYRFRVMVGDFLGGWRELAEPLQLEILPLWWQTGWFRFIAGISIIVAAAGAAALNERRKLHLRLRKLELQESLQEERQRIARDLHDDLGAQITEMVLLGDLAKRGEQSPSELSAQMEKLTRKLRQLVTSMGDTVWAINPKNDSIPELATYLCDHTERFLTPTPIGFRFNVADDLPAVTISAFARQNVFLAVKEALNNAVKHSKAATISLRIHVRDRFLMVSIADDGCGFDKGGEIEKGNGLLNMRGRLAAVGGRAEITSTAGHGTTVAFEIPLPPDATKN